MKKRGVVVVFALLLALPIVSGKAFVWTIEAANTLSINVPQDYSNFPYLSAPLGRTMNVSEINAFGWKNQRRCGTSFVTEFLLNGSLVAIGRLPDKEWQEPGCVPYGYGGMWQGPFTPSPSDGVFADTIRFRRCYAACSGWAGGISQLRASEIFGKSKRADSVQASDLEKDLGPIRSFIGLGNVSQVRISSQTNGIMVWIGGIDDKTQTTMTNTNGHAWACIDTDNNKQCDADQATDCLAAGGDWYKGLCCGNKNISTCGYVSILRQNRTVYVDFFGNEYSSPGFFRTPKTIITNTTVNAFCGRISPGQWAWAPVDFPGDVKQLLDCPGTSLLSNGTALYSCGGTANNTLPFDGAVKVRISGIRHGFVCSGSAIIECGGSQGGFSKANAVSIGATAPATEGTMYCASDGDWTTDLDIKDEETCRTAGFDWTGTKCCSEADDTEEYYNEINTTLARGGCWNKAFIQSGSFAVTDRILNYKGSFYGCRIQEDEILQIKDAHSSNWLVNNSIESCGMVLADALPGGRPHAVCRPNGRWEFSDEPGGTINKSIAWLGMVNISRLSITGCCAFDQCWNGTRCVSTNAFQRIGSAGFVCRI
jgi:hypothetical protein